MDQEETEYWSQTQASRQHCSGAIANAVAMDICQDALREAERNSIFLAELNVLVHYDESLRIIQAIDLDRIHLGPLITDNFDPRIPLSQQLQTIATVVRKIPPISDGQPSRCSAKQSAPNEQPTMLEAPFCEGITPSKADDISCDPFLSLISGCAADTTSTLPMLDTVASAGPSQSLSGQRDCLQPTSWLDVLNLESRQNEQLHPNNVPSITNETDVENADRKIQAPLCFIPNPSLQEGHSSHQPARDLVGKCTKENEDNPSFLDLLSLEVGSNQLLNQPDPPATGTDDPVVVDAGSSWVNSIDLPEQSTVASCITASSTSGHPHAESDVIGRNASQATASAWQDAMAAPTPSNPQIGAHGRLEAPFPLAPGSQPEQMHHRQIPNYPLYQPPHQHYQTQPGSVMHHPQHPPFHPFPLPQLNAADTHLPPSLPQAFANLWNSPHHSQQHQTRALQQPQHLVGSLDRNPLEVYHPHGSGNRTVNDDPCVRLGPCTPTAPVGGKGSIWTPEIRKPMKLKRKPAALTPRTRQRKHPIDGESRFTEASATGQDRMNAQTMLSAQTHQSGTMPNEEAAVSFLPDYSAGKVTSRDISGFTPDNSCDDRGLLKLPSIFTHYDVAYDTSSSSLNTSSLPPAANVAANAAVVTSLPQHGISQNSAGKKSKKKPKRTISKEELAQQRVGRVSLAFPGRKPEAMFRPLNMSSNGGKGTCSFCYFKATVCEETPVDYESTKCRYTATLIAERFLVGVAQVPSTGGEPIGDPTSYQFTDCIKISRQMKASSSRCVADSLQCLRNIGAVSGCSVRQIWQLSQEADMETLRDAYTATQDTRTAIVFTSQSNHSICLCGDGMGRYMLFDSHASRLPPKCGARVFYGAFSEIISVLLQLYRTDGATLTQLEIS